MTGKQRWVGQVDREGRLILPPEVVSEWGLKPGSQVQMEGAGNRVQMLRSVAQLSRLYVEPTNICNLDCVTCMRNVWDERPGRMQRETFEQLLNGLKDFSPTPTVFFGGYGEPLTHPNIVEMVRQVKAMGASVELITNGVLLTEEMSLALIQAGLDWLWVSLDGATPECYEDVRLGAELPVVLENLRRLREARGRVRRFTSNLQLGIAFVAMKRNIADLPRLLRLGSELGAKKFSISNVLAHTEELKKEALYERTLHGIVDSASTSYPVVNLPRMDSTELTYQPVGEVMNGNYTLQMLGADYNYTVDACPFVERGSCAVRWDGEISPCLPLLHTHHSFLEERSRLSRAYTVGNINANSLHSLWNDVGYVALRKRLQTFDFAPCSYCNCCEMPEDNVEDCINNTFPTCGACLWAQGIIQCP